MDQNEVEQKIVKPFEHITRLYNALDQTSAKYGTDVDLYPPEIRAITAIGNHPDSSLKELAQYLDVSKSTATKTVQKLVKKGMAAKAFAANSENQLAVRLTAKGEVARQHHADYDAYLDQQLIAIFAKVPPELLPYLGTIANEAEAYFKKELAERQK
jgi:DNA-binding MarR family transcriptional regulator